MARRSYRVVEGFRWIEGGRLAPGFQWEGGRIVTYEPGDTISVEDEELASIYRHLGARPSNADREIRPVGPEAWW
jgi:hypothetical protein